ncbi:hypothetical protein OV079_09625 [Nannocystis pusilla]|uniref:DUF1549 domain-containing protein n=1 Tax=Nannocystis pusilla TaxID=889268 RepID=A0A9X3EMC2_9BACT|nr:hypothetical protein [Nannocystis pusilla]MCY1005820.1 hypothetical protein [Nannocystis pusilla]
MSLLIGLSLLGCAREPRRAATVEAVRPSEPPPPTATSRPFAQLRPLAPTGDLELLAPVEHLVRVALVLAGRRPSEDEIAAVRRDPAALGSIVDRYLDAPEFGAVVRDMWHEILLLRVEGRFVLPRLGPLAGAGSDADWVREVSEEPLRLIEHVVRRDRPFSEIVTADYTIASDLGLKAWGGTTLPPGEDPPPEGWHKVAWDSEQPMAGILSSGALWLRHPSNGTNLHRGQAHVIADALLCSGFLDRDVPLFNDIDLSDETAVKNALVDDPGCVSCHQTLDPLASHLFGFVRVAPGQVRRSYASDGACVKEERGLCYPLREYKPQLAKQWRGKTGRPPGYFGLPSEDLRSLARQIADDPRFSMCVARRFYGYFMQVGWNEVPDATAVSLQDALIDAGVRVKPLVKAIVMSDDFRAARARGLAGGGDRRPQDDAAGAAGAPGRRPDGVRVEGAPGQGREGGGAVRRGRPDGDRPVRLPRDGRRGRGVPDHGAELRLLADAHAGAADAGDGGGRVRGRAGVRARARRAAAVHGGRRRRGGGAGGAGQLARLHERVLAAPAAERGPEVDASYALYQAAGDGRRGWILVLAALLQDPRVAFH